MWKEANKRAAFVYWIKKWCSCKWSKQIFVNKQIYFNIYVSSIESRQRKLLTHYNFLALWLKINATINSLLVMVFLHKHVSFIDVYLLKWSNIIYTSPRKWPWIFRHVNGCMQISFIILPPATKCSIFNASLYPVRNILVTWII